MKRLPKKTERETVRRAPGLNWLDRAIGGVAPGLALRRLKARMQAETIAADIHYNRSRGRITSPRQDRLFRADWPAVSTSADSAISGDLEDTHALVSDLFWKSPLAWAARKGQVSQTIGSGLDLRPVTDRLILGLSDRRADNWERRTRLLWRSWANTPGCDYEGRFPFWQMQRVLFSSWKEKGDAFVLPVNRAEARNGFRLACQLVEADRVSNPGGCVDGTLPADVTAAPAGAVVSSGIEYSAGGEKTAIWVSRYHPGDSAGGFSSDPADWTRVPMVITVAGQARPNVLHLVDPMRIAQSRGISDYAVVLEAIAQVTNYAEAEVDAAFRASLYTLFITSPWNGTAPVIPGQENQQDLSKKPWSWDELKAGIYDLGDGEDIKAPMPGRPNEQFGPFMDTWLPLIGGALGIPKEILTGHFQTSYTAAQAAMNVFWVFVREARDILVRQFCDPVYQAWLDEAVSTGAVRATGYWQDPVRQQAWSGSRWVGPPKPVIREDIAVESATKRVESRFSSRHDEIMAMTGRDYEAVQSELKNEAADMAEAVETVTTRSGNAPAGDPASGGSTSDGGASHAGT